MRAKMVKETRVEIESKVVLNVFDKRFTKPFEGCTLDQLLEIEELLNGIQKVVLRNGTVVGVRFHFIMKGPENAPN